MADQERFAEFLETGDPPLSGDASAVRSLLADEAMWDGPPAGLIDEIMAEISTEPAAPAVPDNVVPFRRGPRLAVLVSAAALVVVALLVAVGALTSRGDSATEFTLSATEAAPAGATAAGIAENTGSGWEIVLEVEDLDGAPDGTYYQGWVTADDGDRVTIGTFHARDSRDPVVLWSGVALKQYPNISVTLQEVGGGAEWSGDVVLEGAVDLGES